MYGLVNQAIKGLVVDNYGEGTWDTIRLKAGVTDETFVGSKLYDDNVTYSLASAASEVLQVSVNDVLAAFGKYWVLHVGKEKYGSLMSSGGKNLAEFLTNLPNFHSRVMLIYPEIKPPEFKVEKISENVLHLHYFSVRMGLTSFMHGLIDGLSEFFSTPCTIQHIKSEVTEINHDVFEVTIG
jgi:hypothetical protein